MKAAKQFMFEYRFGGAHWTVDVWAANEAEAKEKILAMAEAKLCGEVTDVIPMHDDPIESWWISFHRWFLSWWYAK